MAINPVRSPNVENKLSVKVKKASSSSHPAGLNGANGLSREYEEGYRVREVFVGTIVIFLFIVTFYALVHPRKPPGSDRVVLTSQPVALVQTEPLPWLGLEVTAVPLEIARTIGLRHPQGALVQRVIPGSPAEEAGIQPGDVILSLNDRRIRTPREFRNDISGVEIGKQVQMCVGRRDYRTTIYATPIEAPPWVPREEKISPYLGVEVTEVNPESEEASRLAESGKDGGVLVKRVMSGSPAEEVGIQPGDVIMSFNYRKVRTVREFLTDLRGADVGGQVQMCIMRGDIRKTVYPILREKPKNPLTRARL